MRVRLLRFAKDLIAKRFPAILERFSRILIYSVANKSLSMLRAPFMGARVRERAAARANDIL